MRITANVNFSAQLQKGDSYELPESDAKMLIAAGLASAAVVTPPAASTANPGDTTKTEQPAEQSQQLPPSTQAPRAPGRSRSYSRRDRQAAETSV